MKSEEIISKNSRLLCSRDFFVEAKAPKPNSPSCDAETILSEPPRCLAARPSGLVEATGVEPVSENPLTQPSSWTVYLLEFPLTNADRQAFNQGSPFVHDRFKSERPMHVHH